jgi:hypothetical protein
MAAGTGLLALAFALDLLALLRGQTLNQAAADAEPARTE